jgi:thiol-disulfide isomerase/thioredoxin
VRERLEIIRLGLVLLLVSLAARGTDLAGQAIAGDVVADVRAAMAAGGLSQGEQTLAAYRAGRGDTPEALDAMAWLAQGALAARQFDEANRLAHSAREIARVALPTAAASVRAQMLSVIESSIEVLAGVLVEQGARSDAVHLLLTELAAYRGTPIEHGIQENMRLMSLEGRAAPPIESGVSLGPRPRSSASEGRQPLLLFFWAHWCQDCKAESPMIARLEKYRPQGLAIVAPTRRYGYVEAGRRASPEKELRHLASVRDAVYPFLKRSWVPVTEANHRAYGVAAIPMHVLVDRDGIVRLYRPGRMEEADLDQAIRFVLAR